MQAMFSVDKAFKLQHNGYDCGPGVCLITQAVIQQLGGTGRNEGMVNLLSTPLNFVRMHMALNYTMFCLDPPPSHCDDKISIE